MSKKTANLLLLGFFLIFLIIGAITVKNSMPEEKNERVYSLLKKYMPYELEKKVGGFSIVSKTTGKRENPSASDVMLRLDELEKEWGKTHLRIKNKNLIILDYQNNEIDKIKLNANEIEWIKNFFEIGS